MREILFRGKSKDNGKWVEGFYHCVTDNYTPKNIHYITTFKRIDNGEIVLTGPFEVIPETVGQYTGLKDKNGRKIFEGDIVRYGTDIYEVVFETRCGCGYFGIKMSHIETWNFCNITPANLMEIIGNIHDDPELLKC